MPNYVYVRRDEEGRIADIVESLRTVDEREEPLIIDGLEYKYEASYPTSFVLSGPGWTSNSTIRYEDPGEFNTRKEAEIKRKDMVDKFKETSGFENDATYGERIQQGIQNMLEGKNSDGTIDASSPNVEKVSTGSHESI
jgi:hypothetical protein